MSNTEEFWSWADQECNRLGLSWYKIERQAGAGNATISKRARYLLAPTAKTCDLLAEAFNLAKETVYRKAGLLPPESISAEKQRELLHIFDRLPDDHHQDMAIAMLRTILEHGRR